MHTLFNKNWVGGRKPYVSIITPVYNRREELPRALASIERQTFRDFELIVVDDGSSITVDDIMQNYMNQVDFPVAFIKKRNGGVHTARNTGIRISRGEFYTQLDSDDELKPNALQLFLDAWSRIPQDKKQEYREVVGFCENQLGERIGGHLPSGINQMPWPDARLVSIAVGHGERLGMLRGDLMRANLWPEPEGVTFVMESINWLKLGYQYKSWYIDDVVRIYHQETEVSYSNIKGALSNQQLINYMYNRLWFVNNGELFGLSKKRIFTHILWYCLLKHLLLWRGCHPEYDWAKIGIKDPTIKIFAALLWLPSIIPAAIFGKKHPKR